MELTAGPSLPSAAAHSGAPLARRREDHAMTVLGGPLTFLTPATRIELKREFARLGHYSGPLDDVWDETARAAATAYLDASQ